jgi:hypothetical protein
MSSTKGTLEFVCRLTGSAEGIEIVHGAAARTRRWAVQIGMPVVALLIFLKVPAEAGKSMELG